MDTDVAIDEVSSELALEKKDLSDALLTYRIPGRFHFNYKEAVSDVKTPEDIKKERKVKIEKLKEEGKAIPQEYINVDDSEMKFIFKNTLSL